MQMEAGPTLARCRCCSIPIAADETGGTLHDKLAALGAALLAEGLERLTSGPPDAAGASRRGRDLRT
jgi:methionyl-tRNA formyltransferase